MRPRFSKDLFFAAVVAVVFAGSAIAQPTLTNAVFPKAGLTLTFLTADSTTVSAGSAGANVTWNFSTLKVDTSTSVVPETYISASSTPFAAEFPGANIAQKLVDPDSSGGGQAAYNYLAISNTQVNYLGLASPTAVLKYDDPELILQAPLTFNGTFADQYAYSLDFGGIQAFNQGKTDSKYDGYGTLILPNATLNNVIRLKTIDISVDSSNLFGFISINYDTAELYLWFLPNLSGPLMTYNRSYGRSLSTFNGQIIEDFFYGPNIDISFRDNAVSVTDRPEERFGLAIDRVGPNPVVDELQVYFTEGAPKTDKLELQIRDVRGVLVGRNQVVGNGAIKLPTGQLQPGNYFLTLTDGVGVQTVKFVKF